jgi:hypothetical protein
MERVLNKMKYTQKEFAETKEYLEELFEDMVPGSYGRAFALPKHKGYKVVHRDNVVITILVKMRGDKRHV